MMTVAQKNLGDGMPVGTLRTPVKFPPPAPHDTHIALGSEEAQDSDNSEQSSENWN